MPPVHFHKIVVYEIERERSTPTCKIFLAGLLHCQRDVPLQEDAQDLLAYADSLCVCSGIGGSSEFKQLNQFDGTKVSGQHLHSSACNGSVSQGSSLQMSPRCMQCKQMRKVLLSRLLRLRNKIRRPVATLPVVNTAGQRLRRAVRTLRRKNRKLHTLQDEIQLLQEKNSQIRSTVLEEKIKLLPKKQQIAVRACFEASKRRSLRGYRYDKEWLLECIILRMKSPRLYEHLRHHKILALPSRICLQKYTKNFKASYGFNHKLLDCVKQTAGEMDEMSRHGGLVIDEMKLSKHLDLKSSTEIEGFVNLGGFTEESDRHTKADHGLVVMFQPFVEKWTQIIGVFASNGNVKARILTKIILEATLLCEKAGLYVDYICTDGAPWNRTMWHSMGVHGVEMLKKLHWMRCCSFSMIGRPMQKALVS
ncbi:uncharacterized protein LOC144151209 [Haemaphysalis longicornis]